MFLWVNDYHLSVFVCVCVCVLPLDLEGYTVFSYSDKLSIVAEGKRYKDFDLTNLLL